MHSNNDALYLGPMVENIIDISVLLFDSDRYFLTRTHRQHLTTQTVKIQPGSPTFLQFRDPTPVLRAFKLLVEFPV